ncbi:hypothetical protein [Nocardiopsis baichengensis]|uniref:hypothetical protein n=1 Tax=Nocardiopsis baichengensis TaxID=280240 RepID=UPI00034B280C|nr:hypothetical protein [Nocardiopsis baichengensis]
MPSLEQRLTNLEAAFIERSVDKRSIQAQQLNTDHRINSLADAFMEHRRETREGFRQIGLRFDAVEGRLDSLESGQAELQSEVHTLKGDVATLKTDVSALKDDVSTLKTGMSHLQDLVTRIAGKLDA